MNVGRYVFRPLFIQRRVCMIELNNNQLIFSIEKLKSMNLSYYVINKFVENNVLKKLNRKNYENLNYTGDFNEFVYVNAFFSKGVICLISAASYYELTNIIPQSVDIAIYKKDNVRILPEWPNVSLYYYSKKRHNLGIKKVNVGNDFFYIYDIDKTVADIVYYREKIGIQETKEIIKNYLINKDKNLNSLVRYAKELGCYEVIKTYMEVLL